MVTHNSKSVKKRSGVLCCSCVGVLGGDVVLVHARYPPISEQTRDLLDEYFLPEVLVGGGSDCSDRDLVSQVETVYDTQLHASTHTTTSTHAETDTHARAKYVPASPHPHVTGPGFARVAAARARPAGFLAQCQRSTQSTSAKRSRH